MLLTTLTKAYRYTLQLKEQEHYHAYYSIPVFVGFLVTYLLIQVGVRRYPDFHFDAGGYHIHHYTYGIVLLLVFGYVGLWTRSLKMKYISALAYGVGAAFIIDEAFMWFTLTNPARAVYQDYDLAFFIGAIFLGMILAPLLFDGSRNGAKGTGPKA